MQSESPSPAFRFAISALVVYCLATLNWRHPVLRLASNHANLVALWLFLLLPWFVLIVSLAMLRGRVRRLTLLLAVPSMLHGAIPLLGTSFELATTRSGEPDESFVPLRRLPLDRGGELVVYRTNCGATCSYGVVVRQERVLVPGVLILVRDVFNRYGWDDARVEMTAPESAIMEGSIVHLRRWIYL